MHFLVPNIPLWIPLIPVKVRRRIPDASHLEFDCSEREIREWVMATEAKHNVKVLGVDRRVAVVELFICFAYCPDSFLLRCDCVL